MTTPHELMPTGIVRLFTGMRTSYQVRSSPPSPMSPSPSWLIFSTHCTKVAKFQSSFAKHSKLVAAVAAP